MTVYIIVGVIVLFIVACIVYYLIGSYKIFKTSFFKKKSKNKPLTSPDKKQVLVHDDKWLNSRLFTLLSIPCTKNKKLNGYYLKNQDSHKYLISVHGYRGCYQELSLIDHYLYDNLNFNILMIEQRAHGNSDFNVITFGNKECEDLLKWINYIVLNDPDAEICLLGFSMGASTVLNTLGFNKLPSNVKCAISDSGFSSTKKEFYYILQKKSKYKIANYLAYLGIKLFSRIYGFSFTKNYPSKNLKKCKTPTLLIHGSTDTFVPCYMVNENYDSIPDNIYKQKEIFVGAWHGMAIIIDKNRYTKIITDFINKFIK